MYGINELTKGVLIEIDGVLRSIEFHVRHLPHFIPSTLEKIEIAKLPKCDR